MINMLFELKHLHVDSCIRYLMWWDRDRRGEGGPKEVACVGCMCCRVTLPFFHRRARLTRSFPQFIALQPQLHSARLSFPFHLPSLP
jgi:hypothetical protein